MFFQSLHVSIERHDIETIKLNFYNKYNRSKFLSFLNSLALLTLWKLEIIIS